MKQKIISLFLLLIAELSGIQCFPEVCLSKNKCIQGSFMKGYKTKRFEAFMGIPYAMPPVNDLRFKNPQPHIEWTGLLNATQPAANCLQKNYLMPTPLVDGNEDCLYLNVYRPSKNDERDLAVMVYIHGGGLFAGSAHPLILGPEYFMDTKKVILVTFAYRLGVFGFLSTGDNYMEGNFGLKDQTAALKWVQQNIAAFGGNPKSVTIFGQSAGGAAVHLHMLSNASNGLFHKAIVMSGNAAAPFIIPLENPKKQAIKIAKFLNLTSAHDISSQELANLLRSVDALTLVNSGDCLKDWNVDPLINFRPVIESPDDPEGFLSSDPVDIIFSGNYTQVPWMTGIVPNEGAVRLLSLFENMAVLSDFNEHFDELFTKMMEFPKSSHKDTEEKSNNVINYYLNGNHKLDNTTFRGFMNALTDRAFRHPYYETIKNYIKYANFLKNPVYLYEFNYRGLYSYSPFYTGGSLKDYGVVHCDDLIYLFRSPLLFPQDIAINSTDAAVIKEFVETFVKFAETGKPKRSNQLETCSEETFIKGNNSICNYIEFKNKDDSYAVEINYTFDLASVDFWENLLN